ncbi:hypothetical protein BJ741DRAFT_179644 [Chytriomyces cf. hyalinus JEL632]|nr:hypothetical protein BJ741DRAFT_179644 [Chytriomyces cf. hyalinus JEL632]
MAARENPVHSVAALVGLGGNPLLPRLPNDELAEETDQVLQKHYLGFQDTLLSSVNRQVTSIQEKLNENDRELAQTQEEKTRMGVSLYKSNVQVGRLNEQLGASQKNEAKLLERCKSLEAERDAFQLELKALSSMNMTAVTDLTGAKCKLEEAHDKATKLAEINSTYSSDLKIHKRIESKIKKELQYVDQRRRLAETDLEDQKKITEKLVLNRNEMDLIMEAQKQETAIANQTIAKMHFEITALKTDKKRLEKQWEESMSAMSKRDLTFQSVEEQKETVQENLSISEMEKRALRNELETVTRKFNAKELDCKGLEDQIQFLHTSLRTLESKQREVRSSLTEAQVAESLYKQELDKVSKHHSVAKDEVDRKAGVISDLKGKLERMKHDFELKMRNEVIQLAAKKEDVVRAQAQSEIENTKKEELCKNTNLRQENAQLTLKLQQMAEDNRILQKEKQSLNANYSEINTHYNRLYEEARHLMYDLERKEHDINCLKATLRDSSENDATIPYQISMSKLQKDMDAIRAENDNVQKMWLESQKDIHKCKNEMSRLKDDNVYLRTQLGITDTIKVKTSQEIEQSRSKEFEQKLEYSKLHSEFRKLQPLVEEYRGKMIKFEEQLMESKLQLQKEHENALTATNMLKTEIRRLQEERREQKRSQVTDDGCSQVLERKYILAKEMVLKLKQERTELQRTCFEMKAKADEMEKRYFDWPDCFEKDGGQSGENCRGNQRKVIRANEASGKSGTRNGSFQTSDRHV